MGFQFSISDMGLKLIKAYEGYRPVDRMLVTGQRVIGYGHRVLDNDVKFLSKLEAEDLLKADLAPFEDMINENVYAPLTQSQFDALCSFAFSIGPKAFLTSDTLRALNNGRPLDAANGFDIWRKSEIDGKTYVVDALMRRRTAEKALFLRPQGRTLGAPRVDLPAMADETIALLKTEDGLPVFSKEDSAGIVATAPYDAATNLKRRRTDGPMGILSLSEVYDQSEFEDITDDTHIDDTQIDDTPTEESFVLEPEAEIAVEPPKSLIAAEEEKLKDRLDALIEDAKSDQTSLDDEEWPESLLAAEEPELNEIDETQDNVIEFKPSSEPTTNLQPIDEIDLPAEELSGNLNKKNIPARAGDSASKYIELDNEVEVEDATTNLPYWVMIIFGALMLGANIAVYLRGAQNLLGANGQVIALGGMIIGAMMLLGALYYAFKKMPAHQSDV